LQHSIRDALKRAAAGETIAEVEGNGHAARWRLLAIAASGVLAVSLGWNITHLHSDAAESDMIAQNILSSHVRSLIGTHLLDVVSTDQHTVKPWFNGKLDFSPVVKDLTPQGFPLIGGRVDYVAGRTVAALVFQRRKHVINLFTWPTSGPAIAADRLSRNGYNALEWSSGSMTYWAVSDVGMGDLQQFKDLYLK
jgi:anti-sigma factor RsiW